MHAEEFIKLKVIQTLIPSRGTKCMHDPPLDEGRTVDIILIFTVRGLMLLMEEGHKWR